MRITTTAQDFDDSAVGLPVSSSLEPLTLVLNTRLSIVKLQHVPTVLFTIVISDFIHFRIQLSPENWNIGSLVKNVVLKKNN